ncbi:MAG: DUF1456 family protein [Bacteroidia bacterium]|nr:DUF1456 family protein [Bacteroidia bacterium]MCF8427442.1 DUF1456 family protein [Bacteroidia bacterium]MCF8447494.1 DUF1456 family protein [Bacteroidia bacterium]
MNNNDILRQLRYTFNINDTKMMDLFLAGGLEATRAEISDWMKKEEDPEFKSLVDVNMAAFLNGFIIDKRGKKDGPAPVLEKRLNNNTILRKLKIALNLKDDDMLAILKLVDFNFSKHELSAFFRNPSQEQYRLCKDQVLRNFLHGMQLKYRGKGDK